MHLSVVTNIIEMHIVNSIKSKSVFHVAAVNEGQYTREVAVRELMEEFQNGT